MRTELRAIQQRVGITFIYITHDQGEALTMSDRVAVMSQGVIQQVGDGESIYNNPGTAFVASFVGENNALHGHVGQADAEYAVLETRFGALRGRNTRGLRAGDQAILFVRPESLRLVNGEAPANVLETRVLNEEFEGAARHLHLAGDRRGLALSQTNDGERPRATVGDTVQVGFRPERAVVLPEGRLASE